MDGNGGKMNNSEDGNGTASGAGWLWEGGNPRANGYGRGTASGYEWIYGLGLVWGFGDGTASANGWGEGFTWGWGCGDASGLSYTDGDSAGLRSQLLRSQLLRKDIGYGKGTASGREWSKDE